MTKIKIIGFFGIAAMSVAAYAIQTAHQLTIDGTSVSTRLVLQNGRYLIPVDDVAKYFGYDIKVSGGNAVLTKNSSGGSVAQSISAPPATPTPATELTPPPTIQEATPVPNPVVSSNTGMPMTAVPGTAITTATSNLFPDTSQAPEKIDATVGKSSSVNGFNYQVDSIQDAGEKYKDQFDQRGQIIHAAWKTDKLEVIEITVTNSGTDPMSVYAPGLGDITIFDSQKVGYSPIGMDIRQSPDALNSDYSYDLASMGGSANLMLGPGGKIQYAILASIPKSDRVSSLLINVPAANSTASANTTGATNTAGATITVNR